MEFQPLQAKGFVREFDSARVKGFLTCVVQMKLSSDAVVEFDQQRVVLAPKACDQRLHEVGLRRGS